MLRRSVKLPPGYAITWSGQYEAMERVSERLKLVVPVTLLADSAAALPEHAIGGRRR